MSRSDALFTYLLWYLWPILSVIKVKVEVCGALGQQRKGCRGYFVYFCLSWFQFAVCPLASVEESACAIVGFKNLVIWPFSADILGVVPHQRLLSSILILFSKVTVLCWKTLWLRIVDGFKGPHFKCFWYLGQSVSLLLSQASLALRGITG